MMKSITKWFAFATVLCTFNSLVTNCTMNKVKEADASEVINADIEFSKLSQKEGRIKAFITYCHDEGVLLQPNSYPIKGKQEIEKLLNGKSDTSYTLTWLPEYGFMAQSGDLGYTYGIWTFATEDSTGKPVVGQGTYATIWKKDKEGKWKFILDTGNDGLKK